MDRHSSVSHAARVARRTSDMPSPHGVGAGSSGSGAHLPLLARAVVLGAPLLLVASQLGQSWCGGHGGVEESAGDKGLHVLLLGVTPWVTVALWRMSTESFVAILRGIQTMALLRASVLLLAQTVCTAAALQQTSPIILIATSITTLSLVATLRTSHPGGEASLSRRVGMIICGMTIAGATLHEGMRATGPLPFSPTLILHTALILLASLQTAQPPALALGAIPAEASAHAQSLALHRVKQVQLWKASGVGAAVLGTVVTVAWATVFPALHVPSESTLLGLLLTSAATVPSLLISVPTSRRLARALLPLAPRLAAEHARGMGRTLVSLAGATGGLRAVLGGQGASAAEAAVVGMALLAVHCTESSPASSLAEPDSAPGRARTIVAEAYAPHASPDLASSASALPAFLPVQLRALLKHILRSPESSKIFYFLLLNLVYMVVQVIWGVWTNSLGLISDAIHMAFDCAALAMGLFASVMATWPPDTQYSYGYGRVETLSGFANGVFLILISVFIIFEAVQRVMDPPEMMNMRQLLLVSAGGLGVNLWGMYATGHNHHHGHGGHDHHDHGHGHGHDHHTHDDEHAAAHSHNMRGVFLHVLADTLGSVGVIVSTLLIDYTGWTGFDPIASLFIAGLIIASVIPLVMDSAKVLMLEVSEEREVELRQALSELNAVEGLESYAAPRFWPKAEGSLVGSIHIQLLPTRSYMDPSVSRLDDPAWEFKKPSIGYANAEKVVARVEHILKGKIRGLRDLTIQVEGMDHAFCACTT